MNTLEEDRRRQKRRIGLIGSLALAGGYVGGSFIAVPRIENHLTDKVERQLAERGAAGATVTFSGQDGTIHCTAPIADHEGIEADAKRLYGVRVMDFDEACNGTVAAEPTPVVTEAVVAAPATDPAPPPVTEVAAAATIAAVAVVDGAGGVVLTGEVATQGEMDSIVAAAEESFGAANVANEMTVAAAGGDTAAADALATGLAGVIGTFPGRFVSGEAGIADGALYINGVATSRQAADEIAASANGGDVTLEIAPPVADALISNASLADGKITLTGTVASEEQHQQLVAAAEEVVDPANIIDEIVVDPALAIEQSDVDGLAVLIAAMPPNLVSGESGINTEGLYARGVYASDDDKAAFDAAAAGVGVTPDLELRADATAEEAAALEQELNDYVAANPIQFESNSDALTSEANAILDQVAGFAKRLGGLNIEIQGHTDNRGSAERNLDLSDRRAAAVLDALVQRGVPAAQLTSKGYGLTQPKVANDTPENQAINRRVEFRVAAAV